MDKDYEGYGSKGGYPNRNTAVMIKEKWSHRGEGDGRGREAEPVEKEKDNPVIVVSTVGKEGNVITRLGLLEESATTHGKEIESTIETVTNQIGKEGDRLRSDEMIWQGVGVEVALIEARKISYEHKDVGCGEAQVLILGPKEGLEKGWHQTRNETKITITNNSSSNGTGEAQSKWKRLARGEDKEKENREQIA